MNINTVANALLIVCLGLVVFSESRQRAQEDEFILKLIKMLAHEMTLLQKRVDLLEKKEASKPKTGSKYIKGEEND